MSDTRPGLFTPEEIRAEAAERLARFDHSQLYPGMAWENVRSGDREWLTEEALARVDALGELLPTGVEVSSAFPDEPEADDEMMRRYTTDWIEVTE